MVGLKEWDLKEYSVFTVVETTRRYKIYLHNNSPAVSTLILQKRSYYAK